MKTKMAKKRAWPKKQRTPSWPELTKLSKKQDWSDGPKNQKCPE